MLGTLLVEKDNMRIQQLKENWLEMLLEMKRLLWLKDMKISVMLKILLISGELKSSEFILKITLSLFIIFKI
jgi:hypothetical protein